MGVEKGINKLKCQKEIILNIILTNINFLAVIHGEAKNEEDDLDDHSTPPPLTHSNRRITEVGTAVSLPPLTIKQKPPINVVGDVGGRIAIMVDDLIDNVKPFVDAALILKGKLNIFANMRHFNRYNLTDNLN